MNLKPFLVWILICIPVLLGAQETIINVSISQPRELKVEAGGDLLLTPGDSVLIGTSVSVSGGTPDFSYTWKDSEGSLYPVQTFWAQLLGKYELTVSDANNCSATDELWILTTGLEQAISDTYLSVYPNPSDGHIFIKITGPAPTGPLTVINSEGRLLKSLTTGPEHTGVTFETDLSPLGQGLYFLRYPVDGYTIVKPLLIR